MIEEPPGPPLPLQGPAPRECGWFGSSTELREGLEVMELGVSLLEAAWLGLEREPGGPAG